MTKTYDSKCHDLAEHFGQDEPLSKEELHELACQIQEVVEDFFSMRPTRCTESDCSTGIGGVTLAQMAENMKLGLDPYTGSSDKPRRDDMRTALADLGRSVLSSWEKKDAEIERLRKVLRRIASGSLTFPDRVAKDALSDSSPL